VPSGVAVCADLRKPQTNTPGGSAIPIKTGSELKIGNTKRIVKQKDLRLEQEDIEYHVWKTLLVNVRLLDPVEGEPTNPVDDRFLLSFAFSFSKRIARFEGPDVALPKAFGKMEADGSAAPKIFTNRHGQLTNGAYTLDEAGMQPHLTGSLTGGKSQFIYRVNAKELTLDAAANADQSGRWEGHKAKVRFDRPIGIDARTGELTCVLNVYRTRSGYIHASPGSPQ
jgi:hypothetical protein